MGAHVAETVVKLMLQSGIGVCNSRVLVLGLAFKENCPDLRNTRVVDIIDALREYSIRVDVYDPWIDRAEAQHEYGLHCQCGLLYPFLTVCRAMRAMHNPSPGLPTCA